MNQLIIKDLTVSYHRVPAIHHLNLTIDSGICAGLLGPNGAGKTTLLKTIAGLITPETGSVEFSGKKIRAGGKTIAYLPQRETIDWDFPITVRGLVEMGRYPELGMWKSFRDVDAKIVAEALHLMQLEPFADRQIRALSGGQQQRAFLARAWAQESDIYLLDEPFTGLDKNARESVTGILHRLRSEGKLIMASHHDLGEVKGIFDHVLFINGELVSYGDTASTFTEENVQKTFGTEIFSGTHG
ncbi:MAG: metal ABC transporter ATP-binding protein [Chthoniobacterales bacterium]